MSLGTKSFALAVVAIVGCAAPQGEREDEIASVFASADLSLIRTRPALVAGKYTRMATDPFSFYRGNLPLYLQDWQEGAFDLATTRYGVSMDPEPLIVGDPHPENFGLLLGPDGTFALEPNDFDSADRGPYLWDVRRLVVGLVIAAHVANADDAAAQQASIAAARDVARAAAEAYATSIEALAKGAPRRRFDDPNAGDVVAHLFKDAQRDLGDGQTFLDETVLDGSKRRLRRGVLDADEPTQAFETTSQDALLALPAVLDAYRKTLAHPPSVADLEVLDAVREFGSGVASWPRVRLIVLLRGPSGDPSDDFLLEIKELADSSLPPQPPPYVSFDDVDARVLRTTRAAWATPNASPWWGTSNLLGLPVQVRLESEAQRTLRTDTLTGKRGTPEALEAIAATLGQLLARVHASPLAEGETPAQDIASAIGHDVQGFADEQADVAVSYGGQVLTDFKLFQDALRQLGPRLGVPYDSSDAPPPDLQALFGTPPGAAKDTP